jgi:membrane-associated HD superfamily phosphohydrolase
MVAELQVFGMNDDVASQEAATEVADDGIERLKLESDLFAKTEEKRLKEAELTLKDKIEQAKLKLEKERMEFDLKIQKQKDDAALVREKLKAKTMIANKVVGETKSKKK